MNWYDNGQGMMNNSIFAIFGMGLMVILFFVLVWVIIRIAERGSHAHAHLESATHAKNGPTAIEVLNMRLAKGEISAEEYTILKSHLQ